MRPVFTWLTRTRDYGKLSRTQLKAQTSTHLIVCRKHAEDETCEADMRVGFILTKKMGNSVVRHRVKRRLRAAAAEIFPEKARAGYDYAIIGRRAAYLAPYPVIVAEMQKALNYLRKTLP